MTILLADDDIISRALLREILEREADLNIVEAENGKEAWQLLDRGLKADLCLLDITMPELDGLTLLRMMREDQRFHHTRVFLITSMADRQTVTQAASLNVSAYIVKPYSASKVLQQVRKVKSEKQAIKELPVLEDPTVVMGRLRIDAMKYLQLLGLMIANLERDVAALDICLKRGDIQGMLSMIPQMKTVCVNLGAPAFLDVIDRAHATLMRSGLEHGSDFLVHLQDELQRLKNARNELLKKPPELV